MRLSLMGAVSGALFGVARRVLVLGRCECVADVVADAGG